MASHEEVLALHRYFLQANQMRVYYDNRLAQEGVASVDDDRWAQQWIDMCLWYACLYIVIEGWKQLDLSDDGVDALLASPSVGLLRRFRNGVVHFQPTYWDDRFSEFLYEGQGAAAWARAVNQAMGRYFLGWFQAERGRDGPGLD
ncbi:hypothetical protein [Jiangella endophytica]|uniref:hypothetical protein n=1 Tax=Jiangella endophytica TaxID=1623398 RepID=UPI000E34D074|nr:hypothetical protein [Jiangella endophytica]